MFTLNMVRFFFITFFNSLLMFRILPLVLVLTFLSQFVIAQGAINYPKTESHDLNFIIASDLGRNGYYEQKPIAEIMGLYAENTKVRFIAAAGDVHHFNGVASTQDPLWMTNFELIYSHPDLMIDWFVVCGNHEYRGNTQAVLDYSMVSRRWIAPAKYYTKVIKSEHTPDIRLVFIDTSPLIDKYREETELYPDAVKENMEKQLSWLDSVLTNAPEKWKIVIGHHPVYAYTTKDENERIDMQSRVAPILEKHRVDAYFCGHIHNFQHIKPKNSVVDYVVNSSASLSRKVKALDDTVFCSDKAGFTYCSVSKDKMTFYFIDSHGKIIHQSGKSK